MPRPVEWPYRYEVRVQWRDLDAAGHVNNAVYFTYMEAARISCDFLAQATMGDVLVVEVRPTRVGETSFAFAYDVRDKATGRQVARGESVQLTFDYAANAKKPIPPEMRKALEAGIAAR